MGLRSLNLSGREDYPRRFCAFNWRQTKNQKPSLREVKVNEDMFCGF